MTPLFDPSFCAEGFTYSSPCTIVDKEGLPFPPLDEGALFATQIPIELSQVSILLGFGTTRVVLIKKCSISILWSSADRSCFFVFVNLPDAKFFDGIDDDGSELLMRYFVLSCVSWLFTYPKT